MTLREWLQKDDIALALSSALFGFFSHTGFLAALIDNDIHPQRVTGSSAGSIVASLYASGMNIRDLEKIILNTQKSDFWDPGFGLGLLRGNKFAQVIAKHVPNHASEYKYPLSISAFNIMKFSTHVFDSENMITGIRASCALPGLFHPVKFKRHWYWDGGFLDGLALASVKPNERVLSHIVMTGNKRKVNLIEYFQLSKHRKNPNFVELRLENAVKVRPSSMPIDGPKAYEFAYKQTEKALDQEI